MLKRHATLTILIAVNSFAQGGLRSLLNDNPPGPAGTATTARASKIEQSLREQASTTGTLRVFLALTGQLQRDRVTAIKQAYDAEIRAFDNETRAVRGNDQMAATFRRDAAAKRDQAITRQRQAIVKYARESYAVQQALVESRVQSLGGRVLEKFSAANVMYVEIPSGALNALESITEIAGVFESRRKRADLILTTKVLGAPVLWQAGFTGGTQTAAVIDSGIATTHPGFAHLKLDTEEQVGYAMASGCASETKVTAEDMYGHGTHVAGIVASRGTSDLPDLLGVAPGLGRLVAIKVGVLGTDAGSCPDLVIETPDVLRALESAVIDHAARIVNLSLGANTRQDDALDNWVIDKLSDDYDVTIVIAAGNSGLSASAYQLGDLALSYNSISVANLDPHGTVSRSDDTIAPSSSSGPTPLGRRKPDVAAPGTNVVSLYPGNSYATMTGTSMAAPHITGAAALLYDLGMQGAKEVKALLLNSAQGLGWSVRSGWGSADLKAAAAQANAVESSTIRGGAARYHQVPVDGTMNATLVWNRHITTITPDGSHAFGDFSDLDMAAYEAATNRGVATSSSKIDNVEKVSLGGSGVAVLKVIDASADGAEEPFALAFSTSDYKELAPGQLSLECNGNDEVSATMKVTVTCQARNTGDLPVFAVGVSLTAPAGFLATGPSTFESIQPGAVQSFTLVMATPTAARGANLYTVVLAGTAYGDRITAKATMTVNVRAPKPQDCTAVIDPAPGTMVLSAVAQTFVINLRFPGFDPQEPGLCNWSTFTGSSWFGALAPLSGTGDGKITITVLAAPVYNVAKQRNGSFRISINSVNTNYGFSQLYAK